MSEHRRLTEQEREGLYALLDLLDDVRSTVIDLRDLGWRPPTDLDKFDNGREVIRALATDTRSLVRGPVAPPLSTEAANAKDDAPSETATLSAAALHGIRQRG
jgi:hypothetical protein